LPSHGKSRRDALHRTDSFVATSGNVTDEAIAKYIAEQDVEPQDDDDFKVTE
jgi:hypothetical protein